MRENCSIQHPYFSTSLEIESQFHFFSLLLMIVSIGWHSSGFGRDETNGNTVHDVCRSNTYGNHLIEKTLNVLDAIRQNRTIEYFKANNAWTGEEQKTKRVWQCGPCLLRLLALLFPCLLAAWCSPPLMTWTRMLEASKWEEGFHVKLKHNSCS